MDAVETIGLVKMDILAQGGLAAMRDVKAMLDGRGVSVDLERCVACDKTDGRLLLGKPDAIEPWQDPQVWEMIASGNARAVHHIESPAMTSLSRMCNVREIDGLVAIVSVIRPGAANEGKKLSFTRRYQGLEPVTYDTLLRRSSLSLNSQPSTLNYTYGYDNASRLQTVTDGNNNSATYTYLANSPLVSQITFAQPGFTAMTTTKSYDKLNRLTQVASAYSAYTQPGPPPVRFSYQYNAANQRPAATNADNSYWVYQYDALGQVTSGKKYWPDGTAVAGQQFEYGFDDIGNRMQTKAGGNEVGTALRTASYSANNLNQYLSRDVPGAVDVLGIAQDDATVTVNSLTTYRKGEYYRKELTVPNSSAAVWQSVNVTASLTGYSPQTQTGNTFLPQTPESFTYDLDGNLTGDGRYTYTWDAENRLVAMTALSSVPAGAKKRLVFSYDWRGRRITKDVYDWNATLSMWNMTPTISLRFVYDGWNLIAELDATQNPTSPTLRRSYMWGLDLSGTMQGAGGVGGLLAVNDTVNGAHFVAYDGNGNVTALIKASDGTISAQYEYGPFGELIRQTGAMGKVNPFRFSTKYQDDESDLFYYGYRYYNPSTGRWPSRDPIGELGGANLLYAIAANDLVNLFNVLGLAEFEFVVIKNETGKNNRGSVNNSGDWGSLGSYFSGSANVTATSASTTLTGKGPISGHCCNTVVSKQKGMADNGNAGSIFVFMKDADPGTYSVKLGFSGNAAISIAPLEDKEGNAAQATLGFYGESLVLSGGVSLGRKGPGKDMDWRGSKDTTVTVVIKKKSDRVQIGKYDVTMNLNGCPSELTVTATGKIEVKEHSRAK